MRSSKKDLQGYNIKKRDVVTKWRPRRSRVPLHNDASSKKAPEGLYQLV